MKPKMVNSLRNMDLFMLRIRDASAAKLVDLATKCNKVDVTAL
jgi:hypothetical protein